MKKFVIFIIFILPIFAFDIKNLNNINEVKNYIRNMDIKSKLELEIIRLLRESKEEEAKLLFNLLKNNHKKDNKVLENLLFSPKNSYTIIVSKNQQKLKILKNSDAILETELSCITGKRQGDKFEKGDKKTPNGVYFPLYFISAENLSPIYGNGAFPLNYPNIIDKNIFKKTGNGIWIHATNNDGRKPFSSNGCIVLTNNNFEKIKKIISFKDTPVVIVDDFSYVSPKNFENTKLTLGYFIFKWKKAWENSINGKVDDYIDCYSNNMISKYGNKKRFIKYKKRISQNKKWIDIKIKNLYLTKDGRILDYGHIYVASFDMYYNSNNYKWNGKKILYIIKENGKWKILAEEDL